LMSFYRIPPQGGRQVARLTADPVGAGPYTDAKAGKETRRCRVVAVDALGQDGFPSAPVWQYWRYSVPFVGEGHEERAGCTGAKVAAGWRRAEGWAEEKRESGVFP
jgi:hypothetical protein